MFKVTVFNSKETTGKVPISPYDDHVSFDFCNFNADTLFDAYQVINKNFVLNIPLNIEKPLIKIPRQLSSLKDFYPETFNYIVLDIDDVDTSEKQKNVIKYFSQYKCILGASRSYNGIDNFRMKGILCVDNFKIKQLKLILTRLHNDLLDFCDIDEAASRRPSLNAPMHRSEIFLNNEHGEIFKDEFWNNYEEIKSDNPLYKTLNPTVNTDDLKISDLKSITADSIDELCLKIFQMMQFKAIKCNADGGILFKHPSERKSPGGYFWYKSSPYVMHHFNASKSVNIFDTVKNLPLAKKLTQTINYTDKLLSFNPDTDVIQRNEKFLKVDEELKSKIRDFVNEEDGMFAIRSPMGTGKSNVIKQIISEAQNQDLRVLIITNRISVAEDFQKKYNLKIYNKDRYKIGDSLICQYDSLWRYNIKFFDVVVMDEFVSLMLHSRNNVKNSSINFAKFIAAFNKKIVIADAFLTGFENFLLKSKKHNLYLLDNLYRDDTKLYLYSNFSYFVQMILKEIKKGKITVSCTSINKINALRLLLTHLGYKVQVLTAETPQSTKELIYKLLENSENDKWDCLIYSPTLTVGVSNLNNVNVHFHYDNALTTNVISSIQMVKRTRKTKRIHLFINDRINFLKTTLDEIRDSYLNLIGQNADLNFLFEVNDYGETRLSKLGKKAIQIDLFNNILEFNHKSAFLFLAKYHFKNDPIIVDTAFEFNVLTKYCRNNLENTRVQQQAELNQFLNLEEIEKDSIAIHGSDDVTLNQLSKLDEQIVSVYNDPKCTVDVHREILKIAINNSSFIKQCRYYKILKRYCDGVYTENDLRVFISDIIQNHNDLDMLRYLERLIRNGRFELKDIYNKTIEKNPIFYFIQRCGYKSTSNLLLNRIELSEDVKKYFSFIKIT